MLPNVTHSTDTVYPVQSHTHTQKKRREKKRGKTKAYVHSKLRKNISAALHSPPSLPSFVFFLNAIPSFILFALALSCFVFTSPPPVILSPLTPPLLLSPIHIRIRIHTYICRFQFSAWMKYIFTGGTQNTLNITHAFCFPNTHFFLVPSRLLLPFFYLLQKEKKKRVRKKWRIL